MGSSGSPLRPRPDPRLRPGLDRFLHRAHRSL